jgi:3-oxoacyl-[acyl-carrier protein] reductase
MSWLKDRVIFITGGASGLGREIALQSANLGAKVAITDTHAERLEATRADVAEIAGDCLAVKSDVTNEDEVAAMTETAASEFGGIDILVNMAGGTGPIETPAQEYPADEFMRILELNVLGTFLPCKHAIPHLIARAGGGRIINVAGTSGLRGYPNRSGYSASKWAVRGLTRTLALELGPHDITVNAVCPNVTHGDRMSRIVSEKAARLGKAQEDVYAEFAAQTALGRFIEEEDVANAIEILVSEQARNVTGHDLPVDAGWDV